MSEQKKPVPGEWWRANDGSENVFVCGFDHEGDPVYMTDEESPPHLDTMEGFLADYHHEPLCDGFDWKPKPSEQPATKRVAVRLYWYDGNIVGRYDHSQPTDQSFQEIHSDGNGGWFVEVPQ